MTTVIDSLMVQNLAMVDYLTVTSWSDGWYEALARQQGYRHNGVDGWDESRRMQYAGVKKAWERGICFVAQQCSVIGFTTW